MAQEQRTCLVVREVYETIRDSCYSLFSEICASLNIENFVSFNRSPLQINFANGSKIIFRGLDNAQKLKSIHNVSLIWLEECSEASYDAFKELVGRLRHPSLKLFMILSTNPVAKSNWTYKHFFKEVSDERLYRERILRVGQVYYHHSIAEDNYFLPQSYIATLEEMKTYDPDLYRVARLGRFGVNGLKVLPQFEVQPHAEVMSIVEKIPRRFKFVGMDFGFEKSYNAVIRLAVDDANKHLYIYWEFYKNQMTDDETADALIEFTKTHELIKADSAEPKAIKYFQKRGFNMRAARKWNAGTRHARLENTRKVKRFKKIICSSLCTNTIAELQDLTYAKDKDGAEIFDEFNIDAHTFTKAG